MDKFSFENYTLHYRVSGIGNPVFLLHGFLEDHRMWDTLVPHLVAKGLTVYTFDLPCHGKSRFHEEICSMEGVARALARFAIQHEIERPFVFGHSMGGYIGLELLKLIPIHLTLLHSNFWEDPPQKKADRDRVVALVKERKEMFIREAIPNLFAPENRLKCADIIEKLVLRALEIPVDEISAATRGMRDRKAMHSVMNEHHVHLIHGEKDPIIPTSILIKEGNELKRQPSIQLLRSSGHMSIWEQPEKLLNLMNTIIFR